MKILKAFICTFIILTTHAFDSMFEELEQISECVECVLMESDAKIQGGFPGGAGGMMGGFGGYGLGMNGAPVDKKEIAKQFALNQLQYHAANESKGAFDLNEYFNRVDPKNELDLATRQSIVTEAIKNSSKPFYKWDPKSQSGGYAVNPAMQNLIQSSLATGYEVDSSSYKHLELAQMYLAYKGDADGMLNYLKANFKGQELADFAYSYASHYGSDESGNISDGYFKFLKLALTQGELSDDKVLQLIRQEIVGRSLGGEGTPLADLIKKHMDVADNYRNSFGDNLACEFAKGVYINTDHFKKESRSLFPEMGNSYESMDYEQKQMIEQIKKAAVVNNVKNVEIFQGLGGNLDTTCGDGRKPIDYLKIAMDEGLLAHLSQEELENLGLVERDCFQSVSRLDLAQLCDAASVAYILERETRRNERLSSRKNNSDVKHMYIEGRGEGCSISVLDRIVRENGQTIDREVEVLLNSEEVILKTKSMDELKASIKELYGDR